MPHSSGLSDEQVAEFKEAFSLFDKDGSGAIDIDELTEVMKSLGQNPSRKELEEMIAEVDEDGGGEIDFDEFLEMMAKALTKEVDSFEEMMKCFKVFDKDGTGEISREDLHHIIATMAEKLTEDEIKDFIDDADKDGDGTIDYEEFIRMMMSE